MTIEKIKILQVAHNSEWALARFFSSLKKDSVAKRFELVGVCGVEKTVEDAVESLERGIYTRIEMMDSSGKNFRPGNRKEEIKSALELIRKLSSGKIKYYHVNGAESIQEAYDKSEAKAVVIHSKNTTHLKYIEKAVENKLHVLCEKPLVPVLDEEGKPEKRYLGKLEKVIDRAEKKLVSLMDAEHYSYKEASVSFYENLEDILEGKKIKKVRGEILEKDDPDFWRTKEILSQQNRTGILGDTMCHLLAFVSNLDGTAVAKSREYDNYSNGMKYDIDTNDKVTYSIRGERFVRGAEAIFEVGKFIHKRKKPLKEESKKMVFTLEDDSEVILDFKNGAVEKRKRGRKIGDYVSEHDVDINEYVQILGHFYKSIINQKQSRTSMRRSLRTLSAIASSYELPKKYNKVGGLYKK
ncbi:MAG: Gfo/Idh/MocA family oxidoreductase [archaeon]